MDKEKYSIDSSFTDYEVVNPSFAKVLIKVAYAGKNRNHTDIPKEAFDEASYGLKYLPIVGHMVKNEDNKEMLGGHDEEIVLNNDGNMYINELTRPYGVVGSETPFWKSFRELDGSYREYLCCYGYLWIGRYPELNIIKNNYIGQSMEIIPSEVEDEGNTYVKINKFNFDALCLLMRDEACYEGASITTDYSLKDYKKQYEEMISSFKKYALDNIANEGGNSMEENKIEEDITTDKAKEDNTETEDMACKKKKMEDEESKDKKEEMGCKKKKKNNEESAEDKVDYSTIISDLRSELQEFKNNYSELEIKYNALMEDLAKANDENAKYKLAEREENIKTIFSEYDEELTGFESYDNLKNNNNDYSLDELKNECLLVYGKFMKEKNIIKKKSNKKEEIKQFNLDDIETKTDFSIWSGLKDIK